MFTRVLGTYTRYAEVIKQGWNDVPHLYGACSLGVASFFLLIYRIAHTPPGGYITRFKERYMVMRPEDERLVGYPKEYVTDSHLLK